MSKQGVELPTRKAGQRPGPGAFARAALPKGVTRQHFEAALRKCGGSFPRGRLPGLRDRYGTAAGKKALAKFASCMRENGVNIPAPNTSGQGPVFKTNGLHVRSAAFRKAYVKCSSDLLGAFRAHPGAGAAPGRPPASG